MLSLFLRPSLSLSLSFPSYLPTLLIFSSADGYLRPSPSPTRLKHSSETPENDAISYSDAESDSGFESGTHTSSCTSEATNASHRNEPVTTMSSKSEDSESDEDERIEKAILHLDVKVG